MEGEQASSCGKPKEVTFVEGPLPAAAVSVDDSLAKHLFGPDLEGEETPSWNDLVTSKWRELTRKGLTSDQRELLNKKYAPPEPVAFLKAPTLNQECKVALKNNLTVKRDDYARKIQDQAGVALCALGEAISDFLQSEIQNSLTSGARAAIVKVNEGSRILADLFYRISLNRRALITPALNLNAKNTADTIPVDDLLFGASFGESIKRTASMEKSSKDIVKPSFPITRRVQQPIKQPIQVASSSSGNARAPVRQSRPAPRGTGASNSYRRPYYRPRSRSRRR